MFAYSNEPIGLHDLRYKANILHRDISINNIMYEIRDGAYYFILIDFDMAIVVEDRKGKSTYQTSSKHRTGTLPFMAWELIKDAARGINKPDWIPIPHLLRHDFESLFYVSFWSVTAIPDPAEHSHKAVLADWPKRLDEGSLDSHTLCATKKYLLTSLLDDELMEVSAAAHGLCKWFCKFSEVFRKGLLVHQNYGGDLIMADTPEEEAAIKAAFDFTTLNGHVTRDTLKTTLAPYIPGQISPTAPSGTTTDTAKVAEPIPVLATVAIPDSIEASDTVDARQRPSATDAGTAAAHAQAEPRGRPRHARRNQMTAEQAMAAEEYKNTRLRARKPVIYY